MFDIKNVDIVCPVHNALDFTKHCLETLDEHYPGRNLILVNDCSDADTTLWLDNYASSWQTRSECLTQLFKRQTRGWFTRTINQGLKLSLERTQTEWVIALNSDCEIGAGAFEEMFAVWELLVQQGKNVGMVGCEGPRDPATHDRYIEKHEPDYVTGHCLLMEKRLARWERLRFPQGDNDVRGFTAQSLLHISSDRALSYEWNRRTYTTAASLWAAVGHHGGKSWNYNLAEVMMTNAATLLEE